MSRITFLDNATKGKNDWWRYVLTIILSLGGGIIVSLIIFTVALILYIVSLSANGPTDVLTSISGIVENPFILILMTGVLYGICGALFYICMRFLHKRTIISLINAVSRMRWKMLLKGVGLWFLILFIFTLPDLIFNPGSYNISFDPKSYGFLLVLCLLVFPIQASLEELVFRGYLMQGFSLLTKKPWVPLLVTTLLFGLMHVANAPGNFGIAIMIDATIIGLMLGIIALGDNGIETAMGIHIANNLYVALIFNSANSGLPNVPALVTSEPADPFSGIPFTIIMAALTIAVLFWNRRDNLKNIFRSE